MIHVKPSSHTPDDTNDIDFDHCVGFTNRKTLTNSRKAPALLDDRKRMPVKLIYGELFRDLGNELFNRTSQDSHYLLRCVEIHVIKDRSAAFDMYFYMASTASQASECIRPHVLSMHRATEQVSSRPLPVPCNFRQQSRFVDAQLEQRHLFITLSISENRY